MNDPLPHYVDSAPFNVYETEHLTPQQERFYMAPQWRLIWWKFRGHVVAVAAAIILAAFYISILFSEVLAPYSRDTKHVDFIYAPPQSVHLFHNGRFVGPFVYGLKYQLDMETLKRTYSADRSRVERLRFFCLGEPYRFWGLVEGRFRLVCPAPGGQMFLLGTDRLGRDMLSRLIYGAQVTIFVALASSAVAGHGSSSQRQALARLPAISRIISRLRSSPACTSLSCRSGLRACRHASM
mgnify:CR=1 FL=1